MPAPMQKVRFKLPAGTAPIPFGTPVKNGLGGPKVGIIVDSLVDKDGQLEVTARIQTDAARPMLEGRHVQCSMGYEIKTPKKET